MFLCLFKHLRALRGDRTVYIDNDLIINGINLSSTSTNHTSGADLVGIPTIGSATNNSLHEIVNLFASAGRSTGGEITDNRDGTVAISAGTGFIKATDDDTAELLSFDWVASSSIAVPTDTVRYFGIDYNAGSPKIVSLTTNTWDLDTAFPLGSALNEADDLYKLQNPWWVTDGITNIKTS